jgi:hypothetical protein
MKAICAGWPSHRTIIDPVCHSHAVLYHYTHTQILIELVFLFLPEFRLQQVFFFYSALKNIIQTTHWFFSDGGGWELWFLSVKCDWSRAVWSKIFLFCWLFCTWPFGWGSRLFLELLLCVLIGLPCFLASQVPNFGYIRQKISTRNLPLCHILGAEFHTQSSLQFSKSSYVCFICNVQIFSFMNTRNLEKCFFFFPEPKALFI